MTGRQMRVVQVLRPFQEYKRCHGFINKALCVSWKDIMSVAFNEDYNRLANSYLSNLPHGISQSRGNGALGFFLQERHFLQPSEILSTSQKFCILWNGITIPGFLDSMVNRLQDYRFIIDFRNSYLSFSIFIFHELFFGHYNKNFNEDYRNSYLLIQFSAQQDFFFFRFILFYFYLFSIFSFSYSSFSCTSSSFLNTFTISGFLDASLQYQSYLSNLMTNPFSSEKCQLDSFKEREILFHPKISHVIIMPELLFVFHFQKF